MCRRAGIGKEWTPRELRHTFISLMSDMRMPAPETVNRHELWRVIRTGADAMDLLFPGPASAGHAE